MVYLIILESLITLSIVVPAHGVSVDEVIQASTSKSVCSWKRWTTRASLCFNKGQFMCLNSDCISHDRYCNGYMECDDGSDELYCDTDSCPLHPVFPRCENSRKCIPYEWICNGHEDCPNGDDERDCGSSLSGLKPAMEPELQQQIQIDLRLKKVLNWLNRQRMRNSTEKWGANVDTLALLLYFADDNVTSSQENKINIEISYELTIRLLSQLTSKKLKDIPSLELASLVNAFLVTCINPRNFHGYDLIRELRNRADRENYTNPYVFLALCNAGEIITESDKSKLIATFENRHRRSWKDMQAIVVMALACASKQPYNEVDSETLRDMTLELKLQQYRNGSIINLPITALVLQALISTDSEIDRHNFDEIKALQEIVRNQNPDGSFGDLWNTFLVTPVLTCKSLADINSDHCLYLNRDEISAMEKSLRRGDPKIRVKYSLLIDSEKDAERNLILRVPQNTSLYGVMEKAAEIDCTFKFEYTVINRKPYINTVSEIRDNPLTGKFWFLYVVENGEPILSNESPADIIPKNDDHYIMWYRRGTWIDENSESNEI